MKATSPQLAPRVGIRALWVAKGATCKNEKLAFQQLLNHGKTWYEARMLAKSAKLRLRTEIESELRGAVE